MATGWEPLRRPLFRGIWIAAVASNVGTWMQNVGAVWLMTRLTPSPLMVALVQTATSLPAFLLALPAGALADVVDRRRLLVVTQLWMLAAAAVLAALAFAGRVAPWSLLALTFALGAGAAMNGPAWQAIIPELVPRPELPAAVALNGAGVNVARAVGPALGGAVIALAGTASVFLLNAASFVGVIVALVRWRREPLPMRLPPERIFGAMRSGIRYARHAPALAALLARGGLFIVGASALWALLPVVATARLGVGAVGYGLLLGCLGAGAVGAAFVLPRVRARFAADRLVAAGTLVFALVTLALATLANFGAVCLVLVVGGFAWLALMATFNVAAQTSAPAWVQARALALYLLVFQGGLAAGSAAWGALAGRLGSPVTLAVAAGTLVAGLAAAPRWRLAPGEALDLSPSGHIPEPGVVIQPSRDGGPVMVMVEYRVGPDRAADFRRAMREMAHVRRRDGATRWRLFADMSEPTRWVECFLVDSWLEHLRQHERATVSDRAAWEKVRAFQVGDDPPRVTHLVAALDEPDES